MRKYTLFVTTIILVALVTSAGGEESRESLQKKLNDLGERKKKLVEERDNLKPLVEVYKEYRDMIEVPKKDMQKASDEYWEYISNNKVHSIGLMVVKNCWIIPALFGKSAVPELRPINKRYYDAETKFRNNWRSINDKLKKETRFLRNYSDYKTQLVPDSEKWTKRYQELEKKISQLDQQIADLNRRLEELGSAESTAKNLIGNWQVGDTSCIIEIHKDEISGKLVGWLKKGSLKRFNNGSTMWTDFRIKESGGQAFLAQEIDRHMKEATITLTIVDKNMINYDGQAYLKRIAQ